MAVGPQVPPLPYSPRGSAEDVIVPIKVEFTESLHQPLILRKRKLSHLGGYIHSCRKQSTTPPEPGSLRMTFETVCSVVCPNFAWLNMNVPLDRTSSHLFQSILSVTSCRLVYGLCCLAFELSNACWCTSTASVIQGRGSIRRVSQALLEIASPLCQTDECFSVFLTKGKGCM